MELNIFPVFDKIVGKPEKEKFLNQKAKAVWLTGLSGAGKTTIGISLEKKLFQNGFLTQILDGDNIRSGVNKNLQFSELDRLENIRVIAEVNKLFLNCGIITINCFITPTEEIRELVRSIVGRENLIEIFISTPLNVCEKRDVKGLYKKARSGKLKNFTGIDSPFHKPINPDIEINTSSISVEENVSFIYEKILTKIQF